MSIDSHVGTGKNVKKNRINTDHVLGLHGLLRFVAQF
jgi:hypothetical protein